MIVLAKCGRCFFQGRQFFADPVCDEHAKERFLRKLHRQRKPDPRQDVLDDYREECKADCDRTGRF